MDEIVQQVAQRAGIPEDKARMAVQVVIAQLEKRLPAPLASQLGNYLGTGGSGGAGGGPDLGGLTKGLGGLFGK